MLRPPLAVDSVEIACANTTALNLDVDVVIAEGLGLELILVEFLPCFRAVDLESRELVRNSHGYKNV